MTHTAWQNHQNSRRIRVTFWIKPETFTRQARYSFHPPSPRTSIRVEVRQQGGDGHRFFDQAVLQGKIGKSLPANGVAGLT